MVTHEDGMGALEIYPESCRGKSKRASGRRFCEAIYPRASRANGGISIRNFYFDGTQSDFERDLGIYLELAHKDHKHKLWPIPPSAPTALEAAT